MNLENLKQTECMVCGERSPFGDTCATCYVDTSSAASSVFFSIETKKKSFDSHDAKRVQTKLGYLPMGYGFYGYRKETDKNGVVQAKWFCGSCE